MRGFQGQGQDSLRIRSQPDHLLHIIGHQVASPPRIPCYGRMNGIFPAFPYSLRDERWERLSLARPIGACEMRSQSMPDVPTGPITFLFTDIEGSTTLWEHHTDTM